MNADAPAPSFVSALRNAAPYVHAHHGRVFVLCFGGEAVSAADFDALIYDIALLHSLGVQLVLVHGARPQIGAEIARSGLEARFHGNLRITDRATLDCVTRAVGALRADIEARLSTSLASTPMGGARLRTAGGNWVTARPVGVRDGVDLEHTGEVRRIDATTMGEALNARQIVLLSPLGYSPSGEIFNLRAEDVATAAATALRADKLVFVTPGEPRSWPLAEIAGDAGQIPASEARALLADSGERLAALDADYIRSAVTACAAGVARVHLIGHDEDGAVLRELYTRDGAGLFVHADDAYETTRAASIDDIGGILALIAPLETDGKLVPRSREQLELEIEHFAVTKRDGLVIACAALLPLGDGASAELACVAVHPDYRGGGRAAALLGHLETSARRHGIANIYALTTAAPHWFVEHGFAKVAPDALPVARRELYNYQRNSLVLEKQL